MSFFCFIVMSSHKETFFSLVYRKIIPLCKQFLKKSPSHKPDPLDPIRSLLKESPKV